MLATVMSLLGQGLRTLGLFGIVWGLVQLGIAQQRGNNGGGASEVSGAWGWIIGGLIIIAASALFAGIDTGWAGV